MTDMNRWERFGKRMVKAAFWGLFMVTVAGPLLNLELTIKLWAFVFVGMIWDGILDAAIPTEATTKTVSD